MALDPNFVASPYLQRVGHYDDDESIPAMPGPDPSAAAGQAKPVLKKPGAVVDPANPSAPTPALPPLPTGPVPAVGTLVGQALQTGAKAAANFAVGSVNRADQMGSGILNAATAIPRYAGGFARDVGNAFVGNAPSPNAGQPFAAAVAPQIQMPFRGQGADPTAAAPAVTPAAAPAPDFSKVQSSAVTAQLPGSAAAIAPGQIPAPPAPIVAAAAATPGGSGINSGAIASDGRRLPYGAMVNGVPTFSDGSSGIPGVAGSIPRTMDDATIQNLGNKLNRVPAGAVGNVLSSDATGVTPSSADQVAQLVRNAPQTITGSRPSAAQFADADRLAIASQDPRSAAGIAAHNLSMDAQYGGTARLRRSAEQSLASLTQGTQQAGLEAQQGEQQDNVVGMQGRNELANTALAGQNQLADGRLQLQRAQLTREGHPVTLADGTIGVMNPATGQITPSTLPNGQTGKTVVAKDDAADKRSNEVMDNISKTATELAKNALPPPGAPANWTPDPAALREQAARMNGLQLGTDPKSGKRFALINGQAVAL